jgi:alkaline phosphatase D
MHATPHLTRRTLVARAGTVAVAAMLPSTLTSGAAWARRTPLAGAGRFREGVMSGEPTPSGITLWSRLHDVGGRVTAELEVARDSDFRHVVARRRIATSHDTGHALKARVSGLAPHEQYFYRFSTATTDSAVGRFRTALPADSRQPVRFAFYSCQDFTHGFYNAHEVLADEDVDFVVCLGDYIYAETYHSVRGTHTGVRDDPIGRSGPNTAIVREALTLRDYRRKYALYRSDPALRRVQERFPTVMLWDDHEVQDNYAGNSPGGGLPPEKRFGVRRRRAAQRAFFESMPYTPPSGSRIYRRLRFGRTVDLIVTDQRQYRDNQPCGDAVAPACATWDRPRAFLGRAQMAWVKDELRRSHATWKVMANEVMIMPTKVLGDAFVQFDSWQGYPREREELLTHIRDHRIRDVVFVTGDIHTFIAGDVRTRMGDGQSVAVEFVGGSITSQGLGETDLPAGNGTVIKGDDANPSTSPAVIAALRQVNPWVQTADFDHHGYGKVVATRDHLTCEMVRMQTIKRRTRRTLPAAGFRWRVERGQTALDPAF